MLKSNFKNFGTKNFKAEKIVIFLNSIFSTFHSLIIDFNFIHRHNYNSSINSGDWHGNIRADVCNKCTSWSSLLPNPSDGSNGPTRRYMETSRKRRVCSQTSKFICSFCCLIASMLLKIFSYIFMNVDIRIVNINIVDYVGLK